MTRVFALDVGGTFARVAVYEGLAPIWVEVHRTVDLRPLRDLVMDAIRDHVPGLTVTLVDEGPMNQLSYEVSRARFQALGFAFHGDLHTSIAQTLVLLSQRVRLGVAG